MKGKIGAVGGRDVAIRGCWVATQQLTWSTMACAHLAALVDAKREAETQQSPLHSLVFHEVATRGSHCGLRPVRKAELDVARERFTSCVSCSVDILVCQALRTGVPKRPVHRDSSQLLA